MRRVVLAIAVLLGLAATGAARPGGGHSFGGGGGHSSGGHYSGGHYSGGHSSGGNYGGGGGGGNLNGTEVVIILGIVGVGLFFVAANALIRDPGQIPDRLSVGEFTTSAPAAAPGRTITLDRVRADDPDFSEILFDDFAYALYARAHVARKDPAALAQLAPYLSDGARGVLARRGARTGRVEAALIASMSIAEVRRTLAPLDGTPASDWIRVSLESNLVLEGGCEYAREDWLLRRAIGVKTRPWKGVRTFDCPNCGAHAETWAELRCASCGVTVDGGRFDWVVHEITTWAIEERGPSLTGTTEEEGTDDLTVIQAGWEAAWKSIAADDPAQTEPAFTARVRLVYDTLNRAWNEPDPLIARPYVSDGLFSYLRYWDDTYRRQHLRNRLDDAAISRLQMCKVVRDRCYDAVTVRFWASGKDYTLDARDRVVGGSRSRPRAYSEYWTFIRGAGVRGAPHTEPVCPSCGAALSIVMSGACEYCKAIVTRGDFDWVLARIEQDESYRG